MVAAATADLASAAPVSTVGIAVGSVGSTNEIGSKTSKPDLGGDAIQYFIPLGNSGGTYGVGKYKCGGSGFGTCSDTGKGGETLKMILYFSSVSTTNPSKLTINFEDLDLHGANDPDHFFESLNIFRGGQSLTGGWITTIGGLVTGDNTYQTLNLDLDTPSVSSLWLVLKFTAKSDIKGTNTAEFLRATITEVLQTPPLQTPLPGALVLMGSVLGFFGVGLWRRRARIA
jgi:hypothetical protein